MDVDMDKVVCLLERVTSGNAGVIDLECYHHRKTCTITWKRPRGVSGHKSYKSRAEMLVYVRGLLADMGVDVTISIEVTQEDFLPED